MFETGAYIENLKCLGNLFGAALMPSECVHLLASLQISVFPSFLLYTFESIIILSTQL